MFETDNEVARRFESDSFSVRIESLRRFVFGNRSMLMRRAISMTENDLVQIVDVEFFSIDNSKRFAEKRKVFVVFHRKRFLDFTRREKFSTRFHKFDKKFDANRFLGFDKFSAVERTEIFPTEKKTKILFDLFLVEFRTETNLKLRQT